MLNVARATNGALMAQHLEPGPLDPQVRALSRSALELCESLLAGAHPEDPNEWARRVHDTRRKLKWLRALLRAVRPSLPPAVFRSEDHTLRDAGRHLAEARAQTARTACLRSVCAHFGLRTNDVAEELAFLEGRKTHDGEHDTEKSLEKLRTTRSKDSAFLPELDAEALSIGVADQLRRARKAYRRARRAPTAHNLHEWRKETKYHLHQLELLRGLVPDLAERIAAMKALSELLGQTHDVADLRHHLASHQRELPHGERPDLEALLDAREAELALRALSHGHALFSSKPRELRARIARHLG